MNFENIAVVSLTSTRAKLMNQSKDIQALNDTAAPEIEMPTSLGFRVAKFRKLPTSLGFRVAEFRKMPTSLGFRVAKFRKDLVSTLLGKPEPLPITKRGLFLHNVQVFGSSSFFQKI